MSASNVMTPAEAFPPGEFLRDELEERGWSAVEFAGILGRPVQAVSEILNGKKEITPETALALGAALSTSAELWLNLQAMYRLHQARSDDFDRTPVARRARLRALVPVRELQKLQWLPDTGDLDELEAAVCDLLGIGSPAEEPAFAVAARRTKSPVEFTPEQTAWIAQVKRVASGRVSGSFDVTRVAELGASLVRRIRNPHDLENLHSWLADYQVALVIEQPIMGSKIDGAVLFGDDGIPVVGLSTRGDRMDGFVFTLLHELAHLALRHVAPGGVRIDEDVAAGGGPDIEVAANELAGSWVFPGGFDVGPGRPRMPSVLAAAREYGVHASFVIGRLQRDEILGWGDLRRHVPKVRPFVRFR